MASDKVEHFAVGSDEWTRIYAEIYELSKNQPGKEEWERRAQWDMANVHVMFMNAFEQAYKCANTAPQSDAANYLGYVKAVVSSIDIHHEVEETNFFPVLEKEGKLQMESSVEQHKAFHDGLHALEQHCNQQLEKVKAGETKDAIQPDVIRKLITDFSGPLALHLRAELDALSPKVLKAAFTEEQMEKILTDLLGAIGKHDMTELLPMCLTNCATDNNSTWPPFPWIARYIMGPWFVARKNSGLWKYSAHGFYAKFPW